MAIAVHQGRLIYQNFFEKAAQALCRSYRHSQLQNVIRHLAQHPSLDLSEKVIDQYKGDSTLNPILSAFDRQMAYLRPQFAYRHPENIKALEKWDQARLPREAFYHFPAFVKFLFESHLVSQIKLSRGDAVKMMGSEPALLINGEWVGQKDFFDRFEIKYSHQFKQQFLCDRDSGEVHTFLDNGLGLQIHHPYLSALSPISTLSESEYTEVAQRAAAFIRPEEAGLTQEARNDLNQNRPFILQIINNIQNKGTTNYHEHITNPRHVFIRVIRPDGSVHEFGLGRIKNNRLPMSLIPGVFRSPDIYEFTPCDAKVVTSIPLSNDEAESLFSFCRKHHVNSTQLGQKLSFHVFQQNCTTFVREACKAASIEIPTEMTMPDVIHAIAPEWIKKIGRQLKVWRNSILTFLEKPFSKRVINWLREVGNKVGEIWRRAWQGLISLVFFPLRLALGDGFGNTGVALHQKPDKKFKPPLRNFRTLFDFRVQTPGRVLEWQKSQGSTVTIERPVQFVY